MTLKTVTRILLATLLGISTSTPSIAAEESAQEEEINLFRDPDDGQFDVSAYLATRFGFLPVPIVITGPTLGAGLGLNLLFLHDTLAGKKSDDGRNVPPGISGVAAFGTENESRGAAAYHLGFWQQDRLRTTTFIAKPDLNVDFYPEILGRENDIRMNLEGEAFYQEVKWRVGDSHFLVGGNYTYASLNSAPVDDQDRLLNALLDQEYRIGGLAAVLEYDSRDVIFTASQGIYAKLVAERNTEALGSDSDYDALRAKLFHYQPLSSDLNLALRVESSSVTDDAPYFVYPSVEIRGIASKRYQGQHAFSAEAELNWRLQNRWHLIGFFGSGKAFGENQLQQETDFSDADWRNSGGLGFRYEIARKFGLQAGLDVARGPEETAEYITVGSAWNSFY